MADLMEFYFCHEIAYEEKASVKFLRNEMISVFEEIIQSLAKMANLDKEGSHHLIQELSDRHGEPLVKIAQPLRVALTGKTVSPPMDQVMEALGREEVIRRIQRAIEYIKAK
jgi:glutamyl-tRNA synthetase